MDTNKIKINFLIPSFEGGGAERFVTQLGNNLYAKDIKVSFCVFQFIGPLKTSLNENIAVCTFKTLNHISIQIKLIWFLLKRKKELFFSCGLTFSYHLLLASSILGLQKNCIIGIRTPIIRHWKFYHPKTYLLRQAIFFYLAKKVSAIVCNSIYSKKEILKKFIKKPPVIYIPNLINLTQIKSDAALECKEIVKIKKKYLLAVGRLDAVKNFGYLLSAFQKAKLPNKYLIILGSGPQKKFLEKKCKYLNLTKNVRIYSFHKNPYPFIKNARLLISSSIFEGCPNVILEALALRTPVLATNCPGGSKEILGYGKYGNIGPLNNDLQFSKLMTKTKKTPASMNQFLSQYLPDKIHSSYLKVFLNTFQKIK